MKITTIVKAHVLRKIEEKGITDPNKTYYYLMIMQDTDAGKISVSKEVYDYVKEGENVAFVAVYNPEAQWETSKFRVTGIAQPSVEKAKQ